MFFFFSIYASGWQFQVVKRMMLEKEDTPSFVTGANKNKLSFSQRYNQDVDLSNKQFSNTFREHSYYMCSVTIHSTVAEADSARRPQQIASAPEKASFVGCYAFGSGRSSGSGGAIHCCQCVLDIKSVDFQQNQAAAGGAVCSISSAFLLEKSTFDQNVAHKYGGCIYFQGSYDKDEQASGSVLSPNVKLLGMFNKFTNNKASELGGVLAVSIAIEVDMYECLFLSNKCAFGGGAISATNVDEMNLRACRFGLNSVNAADKDTISRAATLARTKDFTGHNAETIDNTFPNEKIPTHFKGRGGGAICFVSDSKKGALPNTKVQNPQRRFLRTIECCFYSDSATTTGQTFGNGVGNEILLEGWAKLISYQDYISGHNDDTYYQGKISQAVSCVNNGWGENAAVIQVEQFTNFTDASACRTFDGTESTSTYNETQIQFANGERNVESKTNNVPEPTTFTYVATPITKLPQATSSSYPPLPMYDFPKGNSELYSKFQSFLISVTQQNDQPSFISIYTKVKDQPTRTVPPQTQDQPNRTVPPQTQDPSKNVEPNHPQVPKQTSSSHLQEGPPSTNKLPNWAFIAIAAGLLALIALVALIIFLTRKKDEESSTSAVEMNEETVVSTPDSNTATLTNDNPLWTTSVVGESDDPFKNDFEEDVNNGGFFGVGAASRQLT